jgi:hypothetical protein
LIIANPHIKCVDQLGNTVFGYGVVHSLAVKMYL